MAVLRDFLVSRDNDGFIDVAVSGQKPKTPYPKLAIVYRSALDGLSDGALNEGAYLLVDTVPSAEGSYGIYVGESTKGSITRRLANHNASPVSGIEGWSFAVAIYGQEEDNRSLSRFTHNEAQALEYFLYRKLKGQKAVALKNRQPPPEIALKEAERDRLKSYLEHVVELLAVLGCDLSVRVPSSLVKRIHVSKSVETSRSQDQPSDPEDVDSSRSLPGTSDGSKKPRRQYKVRLIDLVRAGYLKVDDRLVPSGHYGYKGRFFGEGKIVSIDGKIQISVNGKPYSSPSSSAAALSGRKAETGWEFWERTSDEKTLFEIRDEYIKSRENAD